MRFVLINVVTKKQKKRKGGRNKVVQIVFYLLGPIKFNQVVFWDDSCTAQLC